MCETRPNAEAPHSTAIAASSTLLMQQILTRGERVAFINKQDYQRPYSP
jgi:hypothetical protein